MDLKKNLTLCEKADTARRASAPPACQWDAENRMLSVDSGSTATYKYNSLGQRVERFLTSGSYTFDYLFGVGGEELGLYSAGGATWFDQNVPMGRRVLVKYGSPLRMLHTNKLGTTTVVTDQTGTELGDMLYYPWGQAWTNTGQPYDRHFASMQGFESPESLYPTDFRKYTPALGRWMSPDPLAGDVTNPQSLNRYAYVLNNPVSNIDPSGLIRHKPDDANTVDLSSLGDAGVLPPLASEDVPGGEERDKVPLSPKDQARYYDLRGKAIADIMNPDCLAFLCSHGIDPTMLQLTIASQQAFNGSRSTVTQSEAQVFISSQRQTVAQGFRLNSGTRAAASFNGTDVYFRQGGFGPFANGNIQESTIEHEALHNLLRLYDPDLQSKLGVPQNPYDTTNIDQQLKEEHCTK